jgi:hypothetical protein
MANNDKLTPPKPAAGNASREAKLAKALRDNLRRRKAAAKPGPKDSPGGASGPDQSS